MTAHARTNETGPNSPGDVTSGTLEAAIEIANRRAVALREIKALLLSGEDDRALGLMRKFLGIAVEHDAKDLQAGT